MNIFYGYTGTHIYSVEKAETRCVIATDAGKTRAKGKSSFCIHFAHGVCIKGEKCGFYHRVPTKDDVTPPTMDIFGREKHRTEKEDNSGTGSFEREGKTLYVSNVPDTPEVWKVVSRHFGEFGEIEHGLVFACLFTVYQRSL